MSNHTKQFFRESLLIFIIISFSYPLGYLIRLLYAKNLSLEEYGLFYAVMALVNFFVIFRDIGLSETLMYYIPIFRVKKRPDKIKGGILFVLLVQFAIAVLIGSILYLSSDWLAESFFKNDAAAQPLKLFALIFILDGIIEVITLSLVGLGKPRFRSIADLLHALFTVVFSFMAFFMLTGIIASTLAYLAARIVILVIMLFSLIKIFNLFKHKSFFNTTIAKQFLDYSTKLLLGTGAGIILSQFITNILTYFSGVEQVGIYSVVTPTAMLLFIFSKPIAQYIRPFASEQWTKDDKESIRGLLEIVFSYLIIVVVPFAFIFFSYPDIIIRLIFGEKFLAFTITLLGSSMTQTSLALRITLLGVVLALFTSVNFAVISSIGKPMEVTKGVYLSAIVNVLFSLLFIPSFGVIGASMALSASMISQFIVSLYFIQKFIRISFPLMRWLMTLIAGLGFLLVLSVSKKVLVLPILLEMIFSIGVSGLAYMGLLFLLGLIKKKEVYFIYDTYFRPYLEKGG